MTYTDVSATHLLTQLAAAAQHWLRVERRGGHTMLECPEPAVVLLEDAVDFMPLAPERRLNPWVTLAEFPWLLDGGGDIAWLLPYLPRADAYSDDGRTWRGAYGPRLRRGGNVDQLASALVHLDELPESRRAVLAIWDGQYDWAGVEEGSVDIPCTLGLTVQLRPEVRVVAHMRSNDLIWGLSGVNLPNWALLAQLVAEMLHNWHTPSVAIVGSNLHVYEGRHGAMLQALCSSDGDNLRATPERAVFLSAEDRLATVYQRFKVFAQLCHEAVQLVKNQRGNVTTPRQWRVEAPSGVATSPWLGQWATFMLLHGWVQQVDDERAAADALAALVPRAEWRLPAAAHTARHYLRRQRPVPQLRELIAACLTKPVQQRSIDAWTAT